MNIIKDESNFKIRIPRIFPIRCKECGAICKKIIPIKRHDIYKDMICYKCEKCNNEIYVNEANYINIYT